jgi:serine/threonine protein kinase
MPCGSCGADIPADAAFCPLCGDSTGRGWSAGPVLIGFTILRMLGHGGAAVVYLARQEALKRLVAIKLLRRDVHDPKAWRRFRREAQTIASLSAHPNVVTVFTAGRSQAGEPFIVTEYLDRGSLSDVIQAEGALPAATVAAMGTAIADALQAAHDIGILHRDVKPANVFLDRNGRVKLGDFGIARLLDRQRVTITDVVAFTPEHAAPEVLRGELDGRPSDVYGLGSTLATALLGSPPFRAGPDERLEALLTRKLTAPAPPLPTSLPSSLAEPIGRALDPDPARRPALADLRRQLAAAAVELGTPVPLPPPTPGTAKVATSPATTTKPSGTTPGEINARPPRRRHRRPLAVLGALAAVALAVALLTALVGGFNPGSQTLNSLAPASTALVVTAPPSSPASPPVPAPTTAARTTAPPAPTTQPLAPLPAPVSTGQPNPPTSPGTIAPTTVTPTTSAATPSPATPATGPANSPTPSALLTPDLANAFVRTYYDLVGVGDYEASWSRLAPEFQRGRARSYEYYVDFWNQNDAQVDGVQLVESTPDRAVVIVDLRLNGSQTPIRDQLTLRAGPDGQPLIAREVNLSG